MSPPTLLTPRLRLRALQEADARHFEQLLHHDGDAVRMTERLPDPCLAGPAAGWIRLRIGPGQTSWAIELREDGTFIGSIGMARDGKAAGLGYWLGRAFWGRGYATEAVAAALRQAALDGVRTVMAEVFTENPASVRVLRKAGFETFGQTVRDIPDRGGRRRLDRFVCRLPATG